MDIKGAHTTSPPGEAQVLRQLADRDQPIAETPQDKRQVEERVMRMTSWQRCGGGWRRRAKRSND